MVIRAYIDFGCDGFFNRGTDWPLAGTTITVRLPDGTVRTAVVDENGNATVSGINLGTGQTLTVMADSAPPSPTWVQQFGYDVTPCPRAPASVTLGRANFGVFDVAFVDFTYTITR